jgi:murein DD-endopeptidase MepM/ murein hydrolase activator NlpD
MVDEYDADRRHRDRRGRSTVRSRVLSIPVAAWLVVTLVVCAVVVVSVDARPAHAQSSGLQAANVALVRARNAERAAFYTLLVERQLTERFQFLHAVARRDLMKASARSARAKAQVSLDDRRRRVVVIESYVAGGTVDALGSVLTSGTATSGPGLARMYSAMSHTEAMTRLQESIVWRGRVDVLRDEAQIFADEAARQLADQVESESQAVRDFITAQQQVRIRIDEQERAMAAVWGSVGGSWRCDGGGRPGTVDSIGSLVSSRQGGQVFDSSRAGRLLPPIAGALPNSPLGWRQDPIEPERSAWHEGVDISAPTGTPVVSVTDGVVVAVGESDDGYGIKVVIDHGSGLASVYAHLSSVLVGVGQIVTSGQRIGLVGSTGRSTGAHLHYELRTFGAQCDPMWGWGPA